MEPADPYPAAAGVPSPIGLPLADSLPAPELVIPLCLLCLGLLALVLRYHAIQRMRNQQLPLPQRSVRPAHWLPSVVLLMLLTSVLTLLSLPLAAHLAGLGVLPGLALALVWAGLYAVSALVLAWSRRPVAADAEVPRWAARIMATVDWVLAPLTLPLRAAMRLFQPPPAPAEESPQTPPVQWDQPELIQSLLALEDLPVHSIMRPRIAIQGLDVTWDLPKVLATVEACGYSRLPVYEGSLDAVRGILFAIDLLPLVRGEQAVRWQELIQPVHFVPETKRVHAVMADFKAKRLHMAMVVDEFGGVAGLVTLQDVLDEIFGDLPEGDDTLANPPYHQVGPYTYIFDGKTTLTDLARALHLPDELFEEVRHETDSVAGLMLSLLGTLPQVGQQAQLGGLKLTAEAVGPRSVHQVRVEFTAVPEEA